MTTTPDNGNEPADLSELTATDALLNRLGRRNASDEDLRDPTAAVLAELVAVVDQSREPDVDAARLIEVLAGRPLYIAGAEPSTEEVPLLIDLTEREDGESESADDDITVVAGEEPLVPISRLPPPAAIPIRIPEPVGSRRWDRALSHVSLPAASVLLLLAVGSGVSAAVTGNPMAPVDGITRVMAQLPGVDNTVDKVKTEISAAQRAADKSDAGDARMHLNRALAGLDDVPDSDKPHLSSLINQVAGQIPTATPTSPGLPGVGVPGGTGSVPGIVATSDPAAGNPSASPDPTSEASAPATSEPTSDPIPTGVPSTPDSVPSTDIGAVDQTPAADPSSP